MKLRLAEIRELQGLRLEDIADQLGVAGSTVQRWEKQTMSFPSERVADIARAYHCRINDIFDDGAAPGNVDLSKVSKLVLSIPTDQRDLALDVATGALERFVPKDKKSG